jgi:nitrile hydratase
MFPLADERARGEASAPQALYSIVFDGAEVWGDDAPLPMSIAADLWDVYLDEVSP